METTKTENVFMKEFLETEDFNNLIKEHQSKYKAGTKVKTVSGRIIELRSGELHSNISGGIIYAWSIDGFTIAIMNKKRQWLNTVSSELRIDIDFVKSILPKHYEVKESKQAGNIHAKSREGLRTNEKNDDEEHWKYIQKAIDNHFKGRLNEICFNTHAFYQDFTIYIKSTIK